MRTLLVGLFALGSMSVVEGADAVQPHGEQGRCSLSGGSPPFSIARTQDVVAAAEAVVRATVIGEARLPGVAGGHAQAVVVLFVDEVLRGADVPDTLRFRGSILDADAVSPELVDEVPHLSHIRRWGGDCMAMTYKQGGEYLLLLRNRGGGLDPYWVLLAPTNNQIGGPDDRWLQWVRTEIARNPARPYPLRSAAGPRAGEVAGAGQHPCGPPLRCRTIRLTQRPGDGCYG
jgi:hypothetical protein